MLIVKLCGGLEIKCISSIWIKMKKLFGMCC